MHAFLQDYEHTRDGLDCMTASAVPVSGCQAKTYTALEVSERKRQYELQLLR